MPDRGHGALHHEDIRARFLCNPAKLGGALRNRTDCRDHAGIFDLAYARRDEVLLDGFLVNSLQQRCNLGFVGFDDFLQNFLRVLVTGLHSFKVQNGQAAQFVHRDGETHIDHSIHRAGEDGNFQFQRLSVFARQSERDIDFIRVNRHAPGYEGDLVEAVGHPRFAVSAYPHSHV